MNRCISSTLMPKGLSPLQLVEPDPTSLWFKEVAGFSLSIIIMQSMILNDTIVHVIVLVVGKDSK